MSITAFQDILSGPLNRYFRISQEIGDDVATVSFLVKNAFEAELEFLKFANHSKTPNSIEQKELFKPTVDEIDCIESFKRNNCTSPYFNHLCAISEGSHALEWITAPEAHDYYMQEMIDVSKLYSKNILEEWEKTAKVHVDWVEAWNETLKQLQVYVKRHHPTGVVWAMEDKAEAIGSITAPPPSPSAGISQELTKTTQGCNSKGVQMEPASFKAPKPVTKFAPVLAIQPMDEVPVFAKNGKQWLIEYQKKNYNLLVDKTEINNTVNLFKCTDSIVTVRGKVHSITLDSCKQTTLVFDSVVSDIAVINCESVQMQEEFYIPDQYKSTITPVGLLTVAIQ
ncbi:hypothetical protein ILUMI_24137 [Ignelater luminosus]|uniref:C-CAP/cofactor C-like domain-containing protein n=1 Tax=Ignelater luminosus TaxID=2038154 RepID=A0A8K0CD66_IGNLU|nr:hypothetical protein ILUMI_24137 [Ignelater luminosus]